MWPLYGSLVRPLRVLIVEDDERYARSVIARVLEKFSFELAFATSNAEVRAVQVHGLEFDGATLDVQLPDGDVFAVAEEIGRLPCVELLVLSSFFDEDLARRVTACGAYYARKIWEEAEGAIEAFAQRVLGHREKSLQRDPVAMLQVEHRLTDRETDIVRLWLAGAQHKEIGARFGISHRTVAAHLTSAAHRCNVPLSRLRIMLLAGRDAADE